MVMVVGIQSAMDNDGTVFITVFYSSIPGHIGQLQERTKTMNAIKEVIQKVKRLFSELADRIAICFLKIGAHRIKNRKISFTAGEKLWTLQPYTPRHARKTSTGNANYWAKRHEVINTPGYDDYIVLDTFESRLP